MFQVYNLTDRTVQLSDLRVEIGPRKVVDLSAIANRADIMHSKDLQIALHERILAMGHHSVVANKNVMPDPEPQKVSEFDEEKLKNMIKEVLSEQPKPDLNVEGSVQKAIYDSMSPIIDSLKDKIASIPVGNTAEPIKEPTSEFSISPEKLAEMQQKSVEQITQNITTNEARKTKIFVVKNSNISNIADNL